MQSKKDASYGVVPVRFSDGQWQVLLIHQISNMRGDSYWILPKGHREGEESEVETAVRELQEETGLTPTKLVTEQPFTLSYDFRFNNERIDKTVTFYIGFIAPDAELLLRPEEVKEAQWCSEEDAYQRITHKNATRLLRNAFSYLRDSAQTS